LWCEERSDRKKKQKLEQENQRYLAELEEERQERVRERLEAVQSGNMDLVQAMGRGRGRGVSILPAWMTEQQKGTGISDSGFGKVTDKEQSSVSISGQFNDQQQSTGTSRGNRRFIDPSCIILIENMVIPSMKSIECTDVLKTIYLYLDC
jgi:hypothetical protein